MNGPFQRIGPFSERITLTYAKSDNKVTAGEGRAYSGSPSASSLPRSGAIRRLRVEDGKRIKLVVEREKYKTAYKELNLIAKNDLTMDLEPSSNKASLGEIVTINVSFNKSVNPEMVWTCDNLNIELTPKGNNIEAYIKIEGWDEKDTKASITGAVKNTTYSKTADVMISTEFELSFKTAPTSLNIGESYLMEINLPIGYDATKITQDMDSQDGVTLRNSTGISNTLEIKSGAVLGNNVKIIVSAAGIAKTAIWEKKINNTIIVRNEAQLKLMSNYPTATFELYDDLRINNWTPINFNGNLDSKYQKIIISYNGTPTTTNSIGEKSYGLFNKLNGNISNLYIEWNQLVANTNGNLYVGGLAGQILGGSIKEVFISGTIQVNKKTGTDSSYIGGLVGLCSGTVTIAECTSAIKITSYGEWSMCGGIVGAARASSDCIITKYIFSGSIDAIAGEAPGPAWDSCAGGIVGELGDSSEKGSITITKCLSKSPRINGEDQWVYCAGILGWGRNETATISDCGVLKDTITGKNTIPMGWLVGSGLYIENIYCTQNGSASITTSGVCKVYDNIEDMPKYQDEYVALITPLPAEI